MSNYESKYLRDIRQKGEQAQRNTEREADRDERNAERDRQNAIEDRRAKRRVAEIVHALHGEKRALWAAAVVAGVALLFSAAAVVVSVVQLGETKASFATDQRPYVWFTDNEIVLSLSDSGQINWTWQITNYGKSPAHNLIARSDFWIDGKMCNGPNPPQISGPSYYTGGILEPPNKHDFVATVSCPGINQQRYANLMNQDSGMKISGAIYYSDAAGTPFESDFCFVRLKNGKVLYCEGNEIK